MRRLAIFSKVATTQKLTARLPFVHDPLKFLTKNTDNTDKRDCYVFKIPFHSVSTIRRFGRLLHAESADT